MQIFRSLLSLSLLVPLVAAGAHGLRAEEAAAPQLPGGASSLQESYDDWSVTCRIADKRRLCAVTQQQMQQNGQRVLAIEVGIGEGESLNATLVLPFGLMLEPGVTLAVDDRAAGEALKFRTCIPAGCLVPTDLDPALMEALRTGKVLKVATTSADGQPTPFSISLKGFAPAIDRLKALVSG